MSSKLYCGEILRVLREHVGSGSVYATDHGQYPRLKLCTIADLLNGQLPPASPSAKRRLQTRGEGGGGEAGVVDMSWIQFLTITHFISAPQPSFPRRRE